MTSTDAFNSSATAAPNSSGSASVSGFTIEQLCDDSNCRTQLNSPPISAIAEPVFSPDDKQAIDKLRAAVIAHLDANNGVPNSASFSHAHSLLPACHWRDTYAAHRHLTSTTPSPDPRQHPDFSRALYSPSTQPSTWSDALLFRFLSARQGDVTAARDQFLHYLQWRESYGVDDLCRQRPMPFADVIESIICHRIHGMDNEGRALYFQRTGLIDPAQFLHQVSDAMLVLTHAHFMETCQQHLQANSLKLGRRAQQLITLIDTAGVGLSHVRTLRFFRLTSHIDQSFYPNQLCAFYMLHAPAIVHAFYSQARRFLNDKTQEKIHIVSDREMQAVVARLGKANVPKEYGGDCQCEGGCVPLVESSSADDAQVRAWEAEDEGAKEETLTVAAGQKAELLVSVPAQAAAEAASTESVVWWRVSIERKDIGMQLFLSTADGELRPLTQPRKLETSAQQGASGVVRGLRRLTEAGGTVRLVLDNSYSRFTAKEVRCVLQCRQRAVQQAEREEAADSTPLPEA